MSKPLSYMSPPENTFEGFVTPIKHRASYSTSPDLTDMSNNTLPPLCTPGNPQPMASIVLPSPPVSPENGSKDVADSVLAKFQAAGNKIQDPVLYPVRQFVDRCQEVHGIAHNADLIKNDGALATAGQDLFASTSERLLAEDLVNKYMQSHMSQFRGKANPPTREEYLLAASFRFKLYSAGGLKRTREEVDEHYWRSKRICGRPGHSVTRKVPVKIAPAPAKKNPRRTATPLKRTRKPKQANPTSVAMAISFKRSRRIPQPSSSADGQETPAFAGRSETLAQRTKRSENYDYNALPDLTPPTSSLPANNPLTLKIEWTGTPLDLSHDPDRNKLHEAELVLASILRLTCSAYLCSKRRIFQGHLQAVKIGKSFRKTDAQKVCNIDVNKASKLWAAYDMVGWFNRKYLEPFL